MPFPLYAFAELGGAPPIEHKLHSEIVAAGPYTTNFLGVVVDYPGATVVVVFDAPPSGPNQAAIDGVIAAHDGVVVPEPVAVFSIHHAFTAGGGGVADDVVIYDGTAPYSFRILDSYVYISTNVALATAQLRNALGGLGNALSDSWLATLLGFKINVALPVTPPVVPMGGSVILRRSDNGIAGEVVLEIQRIE